MGFKFKRLDYTAYDLGTSTTTANRLTRAKKVLKAIVNALIDMNIGWALDTSRNATADDFAEVPDMSGSAPQPGLFLTNSTSGNKLFVAYFCCQANNSLGTPTSTKVNCGTTVADSGHGGVIMSMIPGASGDSFGANFDENFLPATATRLIGSDHYTNNTYSDILSIVASPTSGSTYSFGIYATPYCIAVSEDINNTATPGSLHIPSIAVGRVIGDLAHSEDTLPTARYGALWFAAPSWITSSSSWSPSYVSSTSMTMNSASISFFGINYQFNWSQNGTHSAGQNNFGQIFTADGSISNYVAGHLNAIIVDQFFMLSPMVSNSSNTGLSRWAPFSVFQLNSSPANAGIVPGDGFKGYLDTDLFRCAPGEYGKTYNNGAFICCSNYYNFLIGWDPDNTDQIGG